MSYIDEIKKQNILLTTTENGDVAFAHSGSFALDLFSLMGGMRYNYGDLSKLFYRSFYEDPKITVKVLLHLRNIMGGLGERNSFRLLLNSLGSLSPQLASQIIPLIPKYGRYDDLFALFNTAAEKDVLVFIKMQLEEDIKNHNEGKEISLLAKWLPSVNTSSKQARKLARKVIDYLKITDREYRKTLVMLRKNRIIENYLREKNYTFDYSTVPSIALIKYREAFNRNDQVRFSTFLNDVEKGTAKMNTKTAQVYQLALSTGDGSNTNNLERFQNIYWNNLPRPEIKTKALVVRDGSSSMTWSDGAVKPAIVADSLSIYFSEVLPEPFKNSFITFSENPRLITFPKDFTIQQKLSHLTKYDEVSNTDISKVYKLLLNVAKSNKVKPEDMVEQVVIISDMEFDECVVGERTLDTYKKKFSELNLKMPQLVFWNVAARDILTPVSMNEKGAILVSGYSQKIIESISTNIIEEITPYEYMLEQLQKYSEVDDFIF